MTIKPLALTLVALAFALSACGGSDSSSDGDGGLKLGNSTGEVSTPLPDPPVNTLKTDLTTPEGTAKAYMVFLQLGDGEKVCNLLQPSVVAKFGGTPEKCIRGVENYAKAVLPDFENSLDVSAAVTTKVNKQTADTAEVSAAVEVNRDAHTSYFEGFTMVKVGDEWRISNLASLEAEPAN